MGIEYHCPIHGRIEYDETDEAPRVCPMMLEVTVAGEIVREPCCAPLAPRLE